MKFSFKIQQYQTDAVDAVARVFQGQPYNAGVSYLRDIGNLPSTPQQISVTHHELDEAVLEFGGSISGEHGAGCLKEVGRQLGEAEQALMRAIRRQFDPNGILNPNKGY